MKFTAGLLAVAAIAITSACTEAQKSEKNPGYFFTRIEDGAVSGQFNPEGYTAEEVQALVSVHCVGNNVQQYTVRPNDNGDVIFRGYCAEGTNDFAGIARYNKDENGSVRIDSSTNDANGNITEESVIISVEPASGEATPAA